MPWTELHKAAQSGNLEAAKAALDADAIDINSKQSNYGHTALYVAAAKGHIEVARFLLEKHADVSASSNSGWSPLMTAVYHNFEPMVKLLLQHGANPLQTDPKGETPLSLARKNGRTNLVALLESSAPAPPSAAAAPTTVPSFSIGPPLSASLPAVSPFSVKNEPTLLEDDAFRAHFAIHAGVASFTTNDGRTIPILRAKQGSKYAVVNGITIMEQNPAKSSPQAALARLGKRVTWVMTKAPWALIVEDKLERTSPQIVAGDKKRRLADEPTEAKKPKINDRVMSVTISFSPEWSHPLDKRMRVEIFPRDEEWKRINAMFITSISPLHGAKYGYTTFQITRLERLQDPDLWGHYYLRRNEVKKSNEGKPVPIAGVLTQLLDKEANEYYLFHGCSYAVLDKIIESGFDERVSNLSGMFGCGVYFAEESSKSDQYSHSKDCEQVGAFYRGQQNKCTCAEAFGEERYMFLSRVVMGTPWNRLEPTDKATPLRRPPDRPDGKPYDSVLGESRKWNPTAALEFREFIVYDRRQCYPEYLITYKRIPS